MIDEFYLSCLLVGRHNEKLNETRLRKQLYQRLGIPGAALSNGNESCSQPQLKYDLQGSGHQILVHHAFVCIRHLNVEPSVKIIYVVNTH